VLLEIDQPAGNHNGGMVAFGPDGYLWIGSGDGGGANDRFGHGQRPDTLLATLLRIDIAGEPYAVPPDNPFVGGGGAPEVWAYGLRNPWRFAFDDDRIYVADVGQNRIEEIDVVSVAPGPARNFGWPIMEGSSCFSSDDCSSDGLVLPATEYEHDEGCSVTGGFVYRGRSLPELAGHYFYGDYCAGWVRSVLVGDDASVRDTREWFAPGTLPNLTSFGVDAAGELYVTTSGGTVWRVSRGGTG
jgi:glucose/arabinose dehydrogenase